MARAARVFAFCALLFSAGAAPADEWSATRPPIDETHIERGEINRRGNAVGYHHRSHGADPVGARVVLLIEPPDAHGVYRAFVAVRDPLSGRWIEKRGPSTFFPDAMSDPAVDRAILHAFVLGRRSRNGRFIGPSGQGFAVEGWYEKGRIFSAYPLMGRR